MTFQDDIDLALSEPDGLHPSALAEKLIGNAGPGEFEAWLLERGTVFLTHQLHLQLKVSRAVLHQRARSRAFGVEAASDRPDFSAFAVTYRVDPEGTVKTVANLTREDLFFIADGYEHAGKERLMLAAFHRSIAKKVGRRTVGEVMTPEKYENALAEFTQRCSA